MGIACVTVIIPVWNRSVMLCRAVESVLAQSFQGFELVVVDDASAEDLSEVRCLVEGKGHHWLQMEKNVGPAAARNAGAKLAKNEWLSFLDSDDVWAPDKLQSQVEWHERHPAFEISQCEEAWVRKGRPVQKKSYQEQPQGWIFEDCVKACCISPSCVMMSRRLWQQSGGFDERYRVCEDYELWLRTALYNPVGLVRSHAGPLVTRHGGHEDQLSFAVEAMDRFRVLALLELMEKNELMEKQKQVIEQGVLKRAEVLGKGARKRGKAADVETYALAEKGAWQEMVREMVGLCFQ